MASDSPSSSVDIKCRKIYDRATALMKPINGFKRLSNALKCNLHQREYIKSNTSITYLAHRKSHTDENGNIVFDEKRVDLSNIIDSIDPKKRSICIYSRWDGEDRHLSEELYCVMYYVLEKLISESKTKIFNDLKVVTDLSGQVPDLMKKCFPLANIITPKGFNFVSETGIYTNTIHIHGGELPDSKMGTIPILCDAFTIQNTYIEKIDVYQRLPLFFYNKKDNGEIEDDDFELFIDNKMYSYMDYFKKMNIQQSDESIENVIVQLVETIKKVEDRLLSDIYSHGNSKQS